MNKITIKIFFFLIINGLILLSACSSGGGDAEAPTDKKETTTPDSKTPSGNQASDDPLSNAEFFLTLERSQLASGESVAINVDARLTNGTQISDVFDKVSCVLSSYSDVKVVILDEGSCTLTTMFPGNATIDVRWRDDTTVNLNSTPLTVYVSPQPYAELDVQGRVDVNLSTLAQAFYRIVRIDNAVVGESYKVILKQNLTERLGLQLLNSNNDQYTLICQNSLASNATQVACGITATSDHFFVAVADINSMMGDTPLLDESMLQIRPDANVLDNEGNLFDSVPLTLDVEHRGHVSVNELGNNESYYQIILDKNANLAYEVILSNFDFPVSMEVEYDGLYCTSEQLQLVNNSRRCLVPVQQSVINITVNGNNAQAGDVVFDTPASSEGEVGFSLIVESRAP